MTQAQPTYCHQCGGLMGYEQNGVSHHLNDDGGIDYDTDAEHVAFEDSQNRVDNTQQTR